VRERQKEKEKKVKRRKLSGQQRMNVKHEESDVLKRASLPFQRAYK
jgi:hypothetical protein